MFDYINCVQHHSADRSKQVILDQISQSKLTFRAYIWFTQGRIQNPVEQLRLRFFFSIWVCFCGHSRFTGQQGKGETISLTPLYHFQPFQRHLDINRPITAESSPLHTASSRTRTRNLWFSSLPSVVACTYNSAFLEAESRNGVGSLPVGANCPWVDCVTTCNPALGQFAPAFSQQTFTYSTSTEQYMKFV